MQLDAEEDGAPFFSPKLPAGVTADEPSPVAVPGADRPESSHSETPAQAAATATAELEE